MKQIAGKFGRSQEEAIKALRENNGGKSTKTAQTSKMLTTLTTFTTILINRKLNKNSKVVFIDRKTTPNYKIVRLTE